MQDVEPFQKKPRPSTIDTIKIEYWNRQRLAFAGPAIVAEIAPEA